MFRVRTFGQSAIEAGVFRLTPASVRAFALVLYLAAERGRRVPRATVLSMIFGDQAEPNASHSLRQLLYKLRQSGVMLESKGDEVALTADQIECDYADLLAAERLNGDQLELIKGGFLPDFAPTLTEGYAEWLDAFRARTTLELRRALVRDLARARSVGDWRTCEATARACLALDPLNEEATLGLAEALAAAGSKAQAVEFLDRYLADIGPGNRDLRVPATVLRRRISERIALPYRAQPELPFVGREEEMLLLGERFQRARAGESQCVVLHGEAGIGKSRLAAEFATVAALDGARVVRVAAQPHDVHRPMGVFVDLVPLLLDLPGALGCSPESMAALKRLTTHAATGELTSGHNSESAFHAITTAIDDLVDAIAAEAPLLCVVEDVHWADDMSLHLVGGLVSDRRSRRLTIVLASRELVSLGRRAIHADRITVMPLKGIRIDATEQILRSALAGSASAGDKSLVDWMVHTTGGNPLFIASVTLHHLSTGERFVVPPTLTALIARRLDTVDGRARSVLLTCVLLGKYCTIDRLALATDYRHVDLAESVRDLELACLIRDQSPALVASHWLIADATIQRTTSAVLRLAHHRIASILEAEAEESSSAARWWDCADHWAAAASYQRALAAFRKCADHSLGIGRPREAIQFLSRALDLSLPSEERISIARSLILVADGASEFVGALRGIAELTRSSYAHSHDAVELAELRALQHVTDAIDSTRRRLLACAQCKDAGLDHRARAGVVLMMLAHQESNAELAAEAHNALADVISQVGATTDGLNMALVHQLGFGDPDTAASIARTLIARATSSPPSEAASAQTNAARALWIAGYADEAIAVLERAYDACVTANLFRLRVIVATRLGSHCLDLDRRPDGRSMRWRLLAEEIASQSDEFRLSSEYLTNQTETALFEDDLPKATRLHGALVDSQFAERSGQARRWVRALGLRIAQQGGDRRLSDEVIDELSQLVRRPSFAEVSDLEMAIVLDALVARGDLHSAEIELKHYISAFRLMRSPLDAILWRVSRSLATKPVGANAPTTAKSNAEALS